MEKDIQKDKLAQLQYAIFILRYTQDKPLRLVSGVAEYAKYQTSLLR